MKPFIMLIAATAGALMALPLQAKEESGGREAHTDRLDVLRENLTLTPEQIEKIRPILRKQGEQLHALREDSSLSQDQRREKVRELVKSAAEEIRPLLTPEQQEKWGQVADKFREAVQSRAGERGEKGERPAEPLKTE